MKPYFSHDICASHDEKCVQLMMRHGPAGYGLYWLLIERLASDDSYTQAVDYNRLGYDLRCPNTLVKSVVEDFGLFAFTVGNDGRERFYSESLMRRMQIKDEISAKRQAAAKKRWSTVGGSTHFEEKSCTCNANAHDESCKCNAIAWEKPCKEKKEMKVKKINPPISPKGKGSDFDFPFDENSDVAKRIYEYTNDPELRKRFLDYVRFQYDAGKTINEISIDLELKRHSELVREGCDPVKLLTEAIEGSWKKLHNYNDKPWEKNSQKNHSKKMSNADKVGSSEAFQQKSIF